MSDAHVPVPSTLGALPRATLLVYRRGIVTFLALSILGWLGTTASLVTDSLFGGVFRDVPRGIQAVVVLAAILLQLVTTLAVTYVTADLYQGQAPRLWDSLGRVIGRFWALLRLALLAVAALAMLAAPVLFAESALPGLQSGPVGQWIYGIIYYVLLILVLPFTLTLPALQLEPSLGAVGAVRRTWALVHGAWGQITAALLVVLVPVWLGWGVTRVMDYWNVPLLSGLLSALVLVLGFPLFGIALTLLYYGRCHHLAAQRLEPARANKRTPSGLKATHRTRRRGQHHVGARPAH